MKGQAMSVSKKVELELLYEHSFVPVNIMLDSLASENALRRIVEVGYQWLEWETRIGNQRSSKAFGHAAPCKCLMS